jgi:hypothetical protein
MNMGHYAIDDSPITVNMLCFFVITLKLPTGTMRDCWSQVPIVEHFNCWLAGFHRDNQGLTAGACPNGRHLSLCSPNKNTKTFKSVINSFRPCSGVLTFKSLSTYNLEHWMHKWGLTFWATYSYTINFKTLPANITCNATRTTLICYWNVLDLCTICLWMFVSIYFFARDGILWQAASLRSLWP